MHERPLTFATMSDDVREAVFLEMEELHARYDAGDSMALMDAFARCAIYDMALPDWAANAYMRGYYAVKNWRVGSWDEVFGNPVPKGKRLAGLRERRLMREKVMSAISKIVEAGPSTPIDDQLFERVGEQLGVGKTLVKKVWYDLNPLLRQYAMRARRDQRLPR